MAQVFFVTYFKIALNERAQKRSVNLVTTKSTAMVAPRGGGRGPASPPFFAVSREAGHGRHHRLDGGAEHLGQNVEDLSSKKNLILTRLPDRGQ